MIMEKSRPNILLIFSDQHRNDTMKCSGNPVIQTPNLDKLASEGVVFSNCCTNAPLCQPARASLISGQYVNQHGVWDNGINADYKGPSHVRRIRDSGYKTIVIGKTHLWNWLESKDVREQEYRLHSFGYEETHEVPGLTVSAMIGSEYRDYLKNKGLYEQYEKDMEEHRVKAMGGSVKYYEKSPSVLPLGEDMDTYTARVAAKWIQNYQNDKPFYMQMCFEGPHPPFDSHQNYRDLYKTENIPLGTLQKPVEPVSPLQQIIFSAMRLQDMTPEQDRQMRINYYGKVSQVDNAIGLVLEALRDKGLFNNTWVIYTSDHGEMLGDHRMGQKIVFYEPSLKIPCIIRPPGGCLKWQSSALLELIDITATICEIAGVTPMEKSEGLSLFKKIADGPHASYANFHKEAVFSEILLNSMVMTNRYKMAVDSLTKQPVELYDMYSDPLELTNLVNDPILERLKKQLFDQYLSKLLEKTDHSKIPLGKERREVWYRRYSR